MGALDREPWKLGLFPPSFHSAYSERPQSLLRAQANMPEYQWASFILSASPKSFFPLIVSAQSSTAKQPPEVWQAFNKLVIPHSTREFVKDGLWLKLKVGDTLKGWLPHQCMCPMCQEVETVAHTLYGCKFLRLRVDTIDTMVTCHNHHMLNLSACL